MLASPSTQDLAPGYARQRRGESEHFAGFLARHQIELAGHARGHADPFRARDAGRLGAGGGVATTPFELREEFVRLIAQCL